MIGIQNIRSNKVTLSSRNKCLVHYGWIQLQEINKKEHENCSPICEVRGMVEALLVSKNDSIFSPRIALCPAAPFCLRIPSHIQNTFGGSLGSLKSDGRCFKEGKKCIFPL